MAAALALKAGVFGRVGSSPTSGTARPGIIAPIGQSAALSRRRLRVRIPLVPRNHLEVWLSGRKRSTANAVVVVRRPRSSNLRTSAGTVAYR